MIHRLALFAAISILTALVEPSAADSRTSLGITGCSPQEMTQAATTDGRIVFAGCNGPNGLFYSRDRGLTWSFAGDGNLYNEGRVSTVVVTDDAAYITAFGVRKLLKASLPASASESWSPHWEEAANGAELEVRAKLGRFIITQSQVHTSPGRDDWYVKVYDPLTASVVSSISYPAELQPPAGVFTIDFRVETGGDGSYVYGTSGVMYNMSSPVQNAALYRVAFNAQTGQLGTAWEKAPLMSNTLPVPSGLPGPYNGGEAYRLKQVAITPHNEIYVSFPLIMGPPPQGCNQPVYVSTDFGASFTQKTFPGVGTCTPMQGFSFVGDNYLIGSAFSRDAGQTWRQLNAPSDWRTRLSVSTDGSVVYLEPNAAWALIRTNIGYVRVLLPQDTAPADSDWSVTSGFLAMPLYRLAKGYQNPNNAVICSNAGYSITQSFLSETPAWLPNFCPLGDCYGGKAVAADPNDPSVFYLGGNPFIYKIVLDASGDPTNFKIERYIAKAKALPADLADLSQYGVLYTNPAALPNTLVLTLQSDLAGEEVGGIFFYDLTKPACAVSNEYNGCPGSDRAAVIQKKDGTTTSTRVRISNFIAVSSSVMFAAVGNQYTAGSYRAVLRSIDGGVNFQEMNDFPKDANGNVIAGALVKSFSYDAQRDILYAAYTVPDNSMDVPASVAVLKDAAKGNMVWERAAVLPLVPRDGKTNVTLSSAAMDPLTGQVAAGGQQDMRATMWVSDDLGKSWTLAGTGKQEEDINFLSYDEVVQGSSVRAAARKSRVVQGSSTGLYAVQAPPGGGGGGGGDVTTCSVSLASACKRKVRKGAECKLTASIRSTLPTKKTKVSLQKGSTASGKFKRVHPFSSLSRGKKVFPVKAAAGWYRAVFNTPACTSAAVQIKVMKPPR